jgi:PAS domain-containing protein
VVPVRTTEFEDLLEAPPVALVGFDESGVIRFVNHHTESLFGDEREDLVGVPLETLVPESLRQFHMLHRGPTTQLRRPGSWEPIWTSADDDEMAPGSRWTSLCALWTPRPVRCSLRRYAA